ncbi:IclR family transcriptional regulator [Natrinema gelatinilyticum]|uniref:IclR family transcriptional regulator n=1 Tax=Natrinema gelatinilyticum TaxID=2961571 RepID=UPI0020C2AED1|nr:IclR family transcriptional regulator [Natrinema gelatinilyticum]
MVEGDTKQKTVGATERSIAIMEALKELNGARIAELSEHLDITKSSVHAHLVTLEKHEFVVKQGDEYRLGLRFLNVGEYVRNRNPVFQEAKPKVKELAQKTGEVASLIAEDHGKGVFVFRRKGENITRPTTVGNQVDLHVTAGGKAILANLPKPTVDEILDRRGLPRYTPNTITDREVLEDDLERIRKQGVAFNDQEDINGLRAVGVPLEETSGRTVGALSIYGPAHRLRGDLYREEIPDLLRESANDVQLQVAFKQQRSPV